MCTGELRVRDYLLSIQCNFTVIQNDDNKSLSPGVPQGAFQGEIISSDGQEIRNVQCSTGKQVVNLHKE